MLVLFSSFPPFLSNAEGGSQSPSRTQTEQLFSDIKLWEDIIDKEADNFAGDNLVNHQEELSCLQSLMEQWTDVAVKVFTRHQEGEEQSPEQQRMLGLNAAVDRGLKICAERLSGENGAFE